MCNGRWHPLDAPELQGRTHAAPRELYAADIWSLGIVLHYLVTGSPKDSATQQISPGPGCKRSFSSICASAAPVASTITTTTTSSSSSSSCNPSAVPPPPPRGRRDAALRESLLSLSASLLHPDPARRPPASAVCAWLDGLIADLRHEQVQGITYRLLSSLAASEADDGYEADRSYSSHSSNYSQHDSPASPTTEQLEGVEIRPRLLYLQDRATAVSMMKIRSGEVPPTVVPPMSGVYMWQKKCRYA